MSAGRQRRWFRRLASGRFTQTIAETVSACLRYRVLGLAAEAAFFTILSVPPLLFALAGSIGFIAARIEPTVLEQFQAQTLQLASQADRKSTRLNSSHVAISYAVFCLKKKRKHLNKS